METISTRNRSFHFQLALVAVLASSSTAITEETGNWPQWRGPSASGASHDGDPPSEWSDSKNIRWKASVPGRGHSTPIIWQNHIFVTSAIPIGPKLDPKPSGRPGAHDNLPVDSKHEFVVMAYSRQQGELLWKKSLREAIPLEGGHYTASLASASPVTDGERVYVHFGTHGLYCLDFNGNLIWSKDLGGMHTKHGHGEGSSPSLHGKVLVINWDHEEQSFLVALDKQTGNELWRKNRDEVTSWSTPLILEQDGLTQVIVCGTNRVRSYDLLNGNIIWECGGLSANIVASPVSSEGILYVGSSYEKRMLMAIRLSGARGDITDTDHVLWTRTRGTPYVPSPLLVNGALFFLAHYQNVLTRLDAATGEDAPGAMRLGPLGDVYASPVSAAERVYITDLDGVTLVISNDPVPRLISVNALNEKVSASAALVGSEMFIRGEKHLFCIAEM